MEFGHSVGGLGGLFMQEDFDEGLRDGRCEVLAQEVAGGLGE